MKTHFSFHRFFKLFFNDYRLNYKKNLLFLGAMLVSTALYVLFFRAMEDRIDMNGAFLLLMVAFWVTQGTYTCMTFGAFSSKKRTQQLLTTPSTHAEIFWSKFLSSHVIFPIVFCLYGLLVLQLTIEYNQWYRIAFDNDHVRYSSLSEFWSSSIFISSEMERLSFAFVTLFISSCFLWGAMTFKRYAFLKTIVFWFLLLFVMWPIAILVYYIISGEYTPFCIPFIAMGGERYAVFLPEYYPDLIWYIVSFASLLLIIISRVKFNEKTI